MTSRLTSALPTCSIISSDSIVFIYLYEEEKPERKAYVPAYHHRRSLLFQQIMSCHFGRLRQSHNVANRGSDIGQNTIFDPCVLILRHINERHGIQRVSRIGCSIGILGIVGITVIGYDNHFIAVCLSSLDGIAHTSIDSHDSFSIAE